MLRTYQEGPDRTPSPANDVQALQNEQVVYVPYDNYRNPSREAKHQREPLTTEATETTSIAWGHWLSRRTGSEMCL